jgi:hypothetical protein
MCAPKSKLVANGARGPTRATQLQHCFLDPANGTVVDMLIPFRFHKGWVDLVFGDALGQIHVQVLNQLQAATGASTSVEVKMFVSIEESHFRVPRPGGESFLSLTNKFKAMGYEIIRSDKVKDSKPLKRDSAKLQSGVFTKVGAAAGGELDKLVADIVPAEITGAIAGIALDKPALTEYPTPLVRKDAQYMSANRGVENLERMTLEPSAQYLTDDQFGDNVDETDLKYMLKKPVFLRRFNWSSTDTVGTTLYQTVVSPTHLIADPYPTAGTAFEPTPLGFLASLFTYWRGSIIFIIQVVGSAFHEGRLDFCNHPGTTTPSADYVTAMSQYVNSQTIRNTNNQVEVRVPFLSDTPWKRVWCGEPLSDTDSDTAYRSMDFVLGLFDVRVSVPLKNPNNVANNVDFNVFVCAGDDFEIHSLSPHGGIFQLDLLPAERQAIAALDTTSEEEEPVIRNWFGAKRDKARLQAGDLNTDPRTDAGVIALGVRDGYTVDPRMHHFGEDYKNLRECAKRYITVASSPQIILVQGDNVGQFSFVGHDFGGLLSVLFSAFRLFRGPMNFKLQMFANSAAATNRYSTDLMGTCTTVLQPAGFASRPISTAAGYMGFSTARGNTLNQPPLVRFSTTQVAEFQIPFQSIYHSLVSAVPSDDDAEEYFINQFTQFNILYDIWNGYVVDATTVKQANVQLMAAIGDETRFGLFLGLPRVRLMDIPNYPNFYSP